MPKVFSCAAALMLAVAMSLRGQAPQCVAVPECAALIAPLSPEIGARLSERDRVREIAYRMTIVMTKRTAAAWRNPLPPIVYCLAADAVTTPASVTLVDAVHAHFATARASDGCERGPPGRPTQYWPAGTRDRAYIVVVRNIVIDGEKATALTYSDGTSWQCGFERTPAGWRPTECKVTGVS